MKRGLHRLRAVALAACFSCLPLAAQADPISLIVVGVELGFTGTAALVAGAVATYGGYVAFAAQVIGSLDARRRARKAANEARRAFNASLVDRTTVALAADPPLRAIYGRCVVGGDVVAVLTSDKIGVRDNGSTYVKPDGYKHVVIVIAARQIHAIHDVLIEGVPLGALDADGWPLGGDTAVTRRAYLELQMPAGGTYTAASALQVLSVIDAASGEAPPTYDLNVDYGRAASYTLSGDGRTITNTSGFAVVASVAYDARVGTVRVSKFLGAPDQQADPWLLANAPGLWTATDRLRGLAGIVLTLDLEDTSHQSGIPKVEIDASGFLVHDPRDGATRWTRNPALIIRDYLTNEIGFGVATADIDDASVVVAANACDEAVLISGSLQARYTCDGTLSSDDDREAVLDDLADSMAGQVVQGPAWRLIVGAWVPPVLSLGDADLAGQAEVVQTDTALEDLFNGARARIIPAGTGTIDEPVPYQNTALLAADGQPLWTDVQLPYTNSAQRAVNLLRVMVERNRAGLVVRVPCTLRAWPLQVGDRVFWSSSEYGLVSAPMQVMDWQFTLTGAVQLTLQADAPDIYDLADAVAASPAHASRLPRPWDVARVTGLQAQSGTSTLMRQADGTVSPRVLVSWQPVSDPYMDGGGFIRLRWRRPLRDAADVWQQQDLAADAVGAWITGVAEGERLAWMVQAFNRLGAAGPAASGAHTVLGKSAPASDVAGFAGTVAAGVITWTWRANGDLDHGHTEVRAADGGWGLASPAPLWRGLATSWQEPVSAVGSVTRYVRHVDTTGHSSGATVLATVNVTSTQLAAGVPTNALGAMNADPGCTKASAWELLAGAELGTAAGSNAVGRGLIRFPAGALNSMAFSAEAIPINAARRYRLSARLLVASGNDRVLYVTVRMFRTDNSEITGDPPPAGSGWGGTFAGYVFGSFPAAGAWVECGGDFGAGTPREIPAAAAYVRVGVWGQYTAGSSSLDQFAQDVRLVDVTDVRAVQATADAANAALAAIASDNVLTKGEKPAVILDYTVITNEIGGIQVRAAAYGITAESAAYGNAGTALTAYLGSLSPAWNDVAQDTPIVGSAFRAAFAAVYSTRAVVLDLIAQRAGTLATWAGVSGEGKPANGATRNVVKSSAAAPGSPLDGDVWVDTGATPSITKVRVADAWVSAANLSTGALANMNTVGTAQIDASAVTDVMTLGGGSIYKTNSYESIAHLSGTFSHPNACQLLVVVTAGFGNFATFNNGTYVSFRGHLGPGGGYQYTSKVDMYSPVAVLELSYPGGGVLWNVGTETIQLVTPSSGFYSILVSDITMVVRVTKR